jgi:CheY-like chemotaxis protein
MIEQMLLNLAVNARDAMPGGGSMTVRAETVVVTADAAKHDPEARAGTFLCLSVSDTGTGIPPDVLPHIFEPFFTTKPVGKGTGLGLATTYGIAHQHGGWISVESEWGKGSTFSCFLPIEEGGAPAANPGAPGGEKPAAGSGRGRYFGSETILVVEDEESVRGFVRKTLEFHGYTVIGARDGVEALEICADHGPKIDLLLTDVVMPQGVSGVELARRLSESIPGLKIILTSGYARELEAGRASLPAHHRFLAKPYEFETLLKAVRSSLDFGKG